MNEMKRRMKQMEIKQQGKEVVKQFDGIINNLDRGIAQCREKAKDALVNRNDMESFKLFGRSMKYYTNMKASINAVKAQFENYLIQAEVANTFVNLKGVLGKTAKLMDTMPSLQKNNRDFMKFKKSVMKGQLSMESINSMMANLDPSTDSEMSPDEIQSLKDEILMTTGAATTKVANTEEKKGPETQTSGDFFNELDI